MSTSLFKQRTNKVKHLVKTRTLDETHKERIAMFEVQTKSLPSKYNKLNQLKKELDTLEKNISTLNQHKSKTTEKNTEAYDICEAQLKLKSKLKSDIADLNDQIYDIENNRKAKDYVSMACDILVEYYGDGSYYNSDKFTCDQLIDMPIRVSLEPSYLSNKPFKSSVTKQKNSRKAFTISDLSNVDNSDEESEDDCNDEDNDGNNNKENCEYGHDDNNKHFNNANVETADISDALTKLNVFSQSQRKEKKPVKKRKITFDQTPNKSILIFLHKTHRVTTHKKQKLLLIRNYYKTHI
jgi:hypothetical protein